MTDNIPDEVVEAVGRAALEEYVRKFGRTKTMMLDIGHVAILAYRRAMRGRGVVEVKIVDENGQIEIVDGSARSHLTPPHRHPHRQRRYLEERQLNVS